MPKRIFYISLLMLFFTESLKSQILLINARNDFQISIFTNYISSATVQLNPFINDPIEKFSSQELGGGYGIGISIKKRMFWDNFYISLSTEYAAIKDNTLDQYLYATDTDYLHVRVTESIWMVPVELSAVFDIPSFADNFKIYLGGGLGLYFGDRKRSMIIFETETINRVPKLNLQVICGMEYKLANNMSAIFQVSFRHAQFNVDSKYPADRFYYEGLNYLFDRELNSKIYMDGLKFSLGIGYSL